MGNLDLVVISVYFAILIGVGILGSFKAKTSEDYVLAGRNLGMFMYFGCLAAVILGGASTIGTARLGYEYGVSGIWLVAMLGIGITLLGLFFSDKILNLRVMTISEYLSKRFNKEAGFLSAIVSSLYALMVTVTQIIGMGSILNVLLNWNLTLSMFVGGGLVLFYTVLGGMWSVTMTDVIQFVVMTVGIFFIMLPMSISKVGGLASLENQLPAGFLSISNIGVDRIFQYFLLFALGMVVAQDIWQRISTAKTKEIAKKGTIFAGIYSVFYGITISVIGICTFIYLPSLEDSQTTFVSMALAILPTGVLGLIVAAVVSALMSTASGTLLAASTLITNDIIKTLSNKQMSDGTYLLVSRIVTGIVGLISIIIAVWVQDILIAMDIAYSLLSGGIFVPVLLGLFWPKATSKATICAIVGSMLVIIISLIIEGSTSTHPIIYGIVTSFLILVPGSLLGQRNIKEVEEKTS
ncbi:sodium:solute symporter [Peribacillus butanolivorans]|uniref:sodium:solute symporter n=1 Tax=Peribacillus butanolivorans TaxID=421767 RepID=UPI0035DC62BA